MSWTDERIAKLEKMWASGKTAGQIAEELGGVSRNAVIGKAHRLGLKSRPSPVKPADKAKKSASAGSAKVAPAKTAGKAKTAKKAPAKDAAVESKPQAKPAAKKASAPKPVEMKPAPAAAAETPPASPARAASEPETRKEPEAPVKAAPANNQPAQQGAGAAEDKPRIVSVGPGGFLRQGPGDQQPPIPPAPPRRLVPAKPSPEIADKTSLLDLNERICRWPMGHPGEPDFHFCGEKVNPGFPYCVEHCGRAYQAQLPRGARRPPPPLPFGGPRVR